MNKHCYRLIFSRTHFELRVVSELARSCSNESGQTRGPGAARVWVTMRRLGWLICLTLFNGQAFAEGIIADSRAATGMRPEVINTQNGLPQVNITAPNQAGVSHNQYSQFDIDRKGAILNNSAVMTATQMAGMIQGNPNLNPDSAPARIILNEVNSTNPSQLRGYMEVAGGGRAQVIVANPSGIVCDGCGTINAGRMTLTTGKPQLNADGSIAGYRVEHGIVRIEGGGLNGDSRQDTEYVDVLARAVEVNAGVWAKEKIYAVAGKNTVSADGSTVTPSSSQDGAKPELAIDMGSMGGMYSGQIRMIGTEAGVGVRNQGGQLQAGKTLTVSSEGQLVWQPGKQEAVTQAGESITLVARDTIGHAGKLYSGGTLNVQSRSGEIKQSGTMAAAGDVQLTATGRIENRGHLLAGSDVSSTLNREADLTLSSQGTVQSNGTLMTKKNLSLSGNRVDIGAGQLTAKQATVTAQTGGVSLKQAKLDSQKLNISTLSDIDARQSEVRAGNWDVNADNLFNQRAVWSQTGSGENRFALQRQLDNTGGTIEAQRLSLNAGMLTNHNGRLVALDGSDQHWHVAGLTDNRAGELGSNGNMSLSAGSLNNLGGSVKSMLSLQVEAKKGIDNSEGKLLAGNTLTLQAKKILNHVGVLEGDEVKITVRQLNNTQGQIASQQDLVLNARQGLDNQQGVIAAGHDAEIHTDGTWNNQGGTVQSGTRLKLSAGEVNNDQGKVVSEDALALAAAGEVNNHAGEISGNTLQLSALTLLNGSGQVLGSQSAILKAKDALDNSQGLIAADQTLDLSTEGLLNNIGGEMSAATVWLDADKLDNAEGKVIAENQLTVRTQHSLNNRQGLLEAGDTLDVSTQGDWNNAQGTAQGGHTVVAAAHDVDNAGGRLQSGGALQLDSNGDVINRAGKLTAQNDLIWRGTPQSLFNNDNGSLQSIGNLTLSGGQLTNGELGLILSQNALDIDLTSVLNNQDGGQLQGAGQTTLRADSLSNKQGRITALGTLDMQFIGQLDNRDGHIFSRLSQTLTAGDIANGQGWMGSQGTWRATTGQFANSLGSVQSEQSSWLTASTLDNQQGLLQSASALTMRVAQGIDNRAGKISAQTFLDAHGNDNGARTGAINNAGGKWLAGDVLNLASQRLDNTQHGLLYSQKQLRLLLSEKLDNQLGNIQSGENLTLAARSLQNDAGSVTSQQQLTLTVADDISNQRGALRSHGTQQLNASLINNQQGTISSLGDINGDAAQLDNAGGMLISQGDGIYGIDTLNNQQGKIHSGRGLTLDGTTINNQQVSWSQPRI